MNFCEALKEMMNGCFVSRRGWNGENMYAFSKVIDFEGKKVVGFFLLVFGEGDEHEIFQWHPSPLDLVSDDWEVFDAGGDEE